MHMVVKHILDEHVPRINPLHLVLAIPFSLILICLQLVFLLNPKSPVDLPNNLP